MIPTVINPMGIDYRQPLTLTALSAGSSVTLNATGSPVVSGLKYRTRAGGWQTYIPGTTVSLPYAGDYVQFWNTAGQLSSSYGNYAKLVMTGSIAGSGNVMSMLNFSDTVPAFGLYSLFSGCGVLVSAPKITAKTIGNFGCRDMYAYCTSLVAASELPAIYLAPYAYANLHYGNTALQNPPKTLPATDLTGCSNVYGGMFNGCRALKSAPEIMAVTLAPGCMQGTFYKCFALEQGAILHFTGYEEECLYWMYYGCSSLTSASLPGHSLATRSLYQTFYGCSSLNDLTVELTSWDNADSPNWLSGVASTGTFTCPSGLVIPSRDASGVPENWTIVTQ